VFEVETTKQCFLELEIVEIVDVVEILAFQDRIVGFFAVSSIRSVTRPEVKYQK
jgi:hypothetical protein